MTSESSKNFAQKKVDGGKLVQASVETDGERITDVTISGDFFIYPESEKKKMEEAVKGNSITSSAESLSKDIEKEIDPDTELLGFDIQTIGEIIEEAVENEKGPRMGDN